MNSQTKKDLKLIPGTHGMRQEHTQDGMPVYLHIHIHTQGNVTYTQFTHWDIFGKWEETGESGGNPDRQGEQEKLHTNSNQRQGLNREPWSCETTMVPNKLLGKCTGQGVDQDQGWKPVS